MDDTMAPRTCSGCPLPVRLKTEAWAMPMLSKLEICLRHSE